MPTPSQTRRLFLQSSALALAGGLLRAETPAYPGLIVREHEPPNLEFPFATLDRFVTPTERFYVRCHFPVPKLDARTWRLKVEGHVRQPLELTYDDLLGMPSRTQTALLECAGNSRVFLTPKVRGVAWQLGAVGNAEWSGVPVAAVLDKAGVKDGAVDVVLEGADTGEIRDDPKSPGVIPFARSLPLAKARRPEVLLATKMNGADLTPTHGYPVRAVVPGWYGMASIKWLTRIVVLDRPFQGFFQTLDYSYWKRDHGMPLLVPLGELEVKAEIARPATHEVVPAGKPYRVFGAAWSGEAQVAKVEVSGDGGRTWAAARLRDEPVPYAWRLWEYDWQVPEKKGRHVLMARATDDRGRTQPLTRDPDRRTYMISHVLPIEVVVA